MLKTLTLLTLLASSALAQTYSFNPGVTCIAAAYGYQPIYQVQTCGSKENQFTSAPNADGSTITFFIAAGEITVTKNNADGTSTYFGPVPVTISTGLRTTITSSTANGSFTFQRGGCWGGGRSNPEHCNVSSVGSPSGTLTVSQ